MVAKIIHIFVIAIIILIVGNLPVSAQTCTTQIQECIDQKILSCTDCNNYLEKKQSEKQTQADTLSAQIGVMDAQINLTESRIEATKQQLSDLNLDIVTATKKVNNLQSSLDNLIKTLLNRMVATYEIGQAQPFGILLTSTNVTNFFSRLNYLKVVQTHDKQLIYLTQQAKNDYANQKNIFEDKKKRVTALKAQLETYTNQLEQNKKEKQDFLNITLGDKARYDQLLTQSRSQLAQFQGFVQGQGGVNLIDADPNWPSYYFSQRDKRWGNVNIAGFYSSPSYVTTIGESGCLISSVAMTLSKKGGSNNPFGVGTNGSYFFNAYFLWDSLRSLGFNTPMRTMDTSVIDNSLSQGKWVIVGLTHTACTSCDPFHFVVITAKNGGDYNLFDPWKGPNTSLNSSYGSDYITEIITY